MKTHILTELTGTAIEGDFRDETGIMQKVHEEPVKGFFRSTQLGHAGVQLRRGEFRVVIPLAKLWELGISIEPQLQPTPPTPQQVVAPEPAVPGL